VSSGMTLRSPPRSPLPPHSPLPPRSPLPPPLAATGCACARACMLVRVCVARVCVLCVCARAVRVCVRVRRMCVCAVCVRVGACARVRAQHPTCPDRPRAGGTPVQGRADSGGVWWSTPARHRTLDKEATASGRCSLAARSAWASGVVYRHGCDGVTSQAPGRDTPSASKGRGPRVHPPHRPNLARGEHARLARASRVPRTRGGCRRGCHHWHGSVHR